MREILLTQNQIALVDDCDFERLNRFKWHADKGRNTFYAKRNTPTINGKRHRISMHHEIIGRPPKGLMTDHKDGNGLRNLRNNLRHVTNRQNSQNKKGIKKTSKYPGVYWHKNIKRWIARIRIKGIQKYLGCFTNEEEAFEIYKQAINHLNEKIVKSDNYVY